MPIYRQLRISTPCHERPAEGRLREKPPQGKRPRKRFFTGPLWTALFDLGKDRRLTTRLGKGLIKGPDPGES